MIKATLRQQSTPAPAASQKTIEVTSQVVSIGGEKIECKNTASTLTSTLAAAGTKTAAPAETVSPPPAVTETAPTETATPDAVAGGLEDFIPDAEEVEPSQNPEASNPRNESSQAVATVPHTTASVEAANNYGTDGLGGEWGGEDLKFPQLKQVQGSGPLSQEYDSGTILYGENELFPPPSVKEGAVNPVLRFVPVSLTKQYREKLGQDSVDAGEMPRIVSSVQEVEELGGTTRWIGSERPDNYWEPSARCILLLQQPETNEHPGFALELDGKNWGVAVYYAAGGAFRDSAKIIFNTALTSLLVPVTDASGRPVMTPRGIMKKPMLWKCVWSLSFAKKKAGNFTPWRPIVKLLVKEQTGPEVRAYCEQLISGAPDAAASEE